MASVPFPEHLDLVNKLTIDPPNSVDQSIPNEPAIAKTDKRAILMYLSTELATSLLEELYPHMNFVGRRSADNIDALHAQKSKGRQIVLAEDPQLHLVWHRDRIYIKPLPYCLLSHEFWLENLIGDSETIKSLHALAGGFVRSFSHLILHESDFHIAQETHLLPSTLTYIDMQKFLFCFRSLADTQVSRRYHYGQLRLSRLNWAVRILQPVARRNKTWLGRVYYHQHDFEVNRFITRNAAPLLFVFAAVSLILSAMQVVLAARGNDQWSVFLDVSWGFSIVVIVTLLVLLVLALGVVFGVLLSQLWFSLGEKSRLSLSPAKK